MKKLIFCFLTILTLTSCLQSGGTASSVQTTRVSDSESSISDTKDSPTQQTDYITYAEAHDAFATELSEQRNDPNEVSTPPEGIFTLDYYRSEVGDLAAYVSCDPQDGQKHPMVIWVFGGWGNGIDGSAWSYPTWDNDQTGSAFREEGLLMMYPSFRGGMGNHGYDETFFGEVDDIMAAYEYAASLPFVDPDRIYLGGHSTGGTKALLAAEYADKFRAVFAFGAADEIMSHNRSQFTFDTSDEEERKMRSPIYWLEDVKTPTFVIEGENGQNEQCVANMDEATENPYLEFFVIEDADHFNVLAPLTRLAARKIANDTGEECNISFTAQELQDEMMIPQVTPQPALVPFVTNEFRMMIPVGWEIENENNEYYITAPYYDENFWDASQIYFEQFESEYISYDEYLNDLREDGLRLQGSGHVVSPEGVSLYDVDAHMVQDGVSYYCKLYMYQMEGSPYVYTLSCYVEEVYQEPANILFETISLSVKFE